MEELMSSAQLPNHQKLHKNGTKQFCFLSLQMYVNLVFYLCIFLGYFMHFICAFLTYTLQRKLYFQHNFSFLVVIFLFYY